MIKAASLLTKNEKMVRISEITIKTPFGEIKGRIIYEPEHAGYTLTLPGRDFGYDARPDGEEDFIVELIRNPKEWFLKFIGRPRKLVYKIPKKKIDIPELEAKNPFGYVFHFIEKTLVKKRGIFMPLSGVGFDTNDGLYFWKTPEPTEYDQTPYDQLVKKLRFAGLEFSEKILVRAPSF